MAPGELHFEDYIIGTRYASQGRTVTEADIVLHAGHTGDFFPHHVDAEWCATQPFGQRIAHGTLIFAMGVGLNISGINPLAMSYGYDRLRFVRPVFIGDTIRAESEITGKRDHRRDPERFGIVEEQLTIMKQGPEVVLSAVHLYLVTKRDSGDQPAGS